MVHRYHLEFCEKGVYQVIFLTCSDPGMKSKKSISHTVLPIRRTSQRKRGSTGYDGYKNVNRNKLSALVDRNGFPLACTVSPTNFHDSWFYKLTLEAFEIPDVQERPAIISADAVYDAREIRQYNRKQRIKSNIPVNRRSQNTRDAGADLVRSRILQEAQCRRTVLQLD